MLGSGGATTVRRGKALRGSPERPALWLLKTDGLGQPLGGCPRPSQGPAPTAPLSLRRLERTRWATSSGAHLRTHPHSHPEVPQRPYLFSLAAR
jgi:hypothetical protein